MHRPHRSSSMTTAVSRIDEHAAPSSEGRRPIAAIVADLSKPVAPRHLRTRKQGGNTISFIEWHVACNYLDHFAPGWSWEIVSISEHGGLTVVHGALSIPASDGVVTRHATGIEDTDNKGLWRRCFECERDGVQASGGDVRTRSASVQQITGLIKLRPRPAAKRAAGHFTSQSCTHQTLCVVLQKRDEPCHGLIRFGDKFQRALRATPVPARFASADVHASQLPIPGSTEPPKDTAPVRIQPKLAVGGPRPESPSV